MRLTTTSFTSGGGGSVAVPGQQCPSHQQLHDPARRCRTGGCTGVASISVWISLEETPAQLGSGALHPHDTEVFCLIQTELPALHSAPAAPPQGSPSSSHLPAAPAVPSLGQSRAGQQLPALLAPLPPRNHQPSGPLGDTAGSWSTAVGQLLDKSWSTVAQPGPPGASLQSPPPASSASAQLGVSRGDSRLGGGDRAQVTPW